ncbi:putative LL-diaminopimelate aminotransferase [Helianthus anomalus]
MKNQAVATICGLITSNQLSVCKVYLLLFGLWTTTSQVYRLIKAFNVYVCAIVVSHLCLTYKQELMMLIKQEPRGSTRCVMSTTGFAFFTFESYGLYEVEQSGKQLRAQLGSWFYTIIGIEDDGLFVSNGAQFHISCCQRFWFQLFKYDLVTWISVVLVYTFVYHMMEPPVEYYQNVEEENVESCGGGGGGGGFGPLVVEAEWPPGVEETDISTKQFKDYSRNEMTKKYKRLKTERNP